MKKQQLMSESEQNDREDDVFPILNREIGSRIDDVCRAIGGREKAAQAAGVSAGMLRRYIRGESMPPLDVVMNLARAAGKSVDSIAFGASQLDGLGPTDRKVLSVSDTMGNPVDLSEFVFVPRYKVAAAAGHGAALADDGTPCAMAFRRKWVDNCLRVSPRELAVLSVKGDSMEGVLSDRDVILVNKADSRPGAGLYVLRIDGELFVKRLQRLPMGKLEVSSANEAYRPFTIDMAAPPSDFEVIGRVVWVGRQI